MNDLLSFVARGALATSLLATAAALPQGSDWPQWRGPDRSGISTETAWSPEGAEAPLWTRDLGLGHSSFAVVGHRVYTVGHDAESAEDTVWCLDAESGDVLWSHRHRAAIWDIAHDGGALTTPTIVGDAVYVSNREGKVLSLAAETGIVRWKRALIEELGVEPHTWGFSASPLAVDGRILMNVGKVVALDMESGTEAWTTERNYGFAYSTPTAFELDGRPLLANLAGDGLAVLDRRDGSEVAFYEWIKRPQIYPMTPVVIGDRIFISGGYERGCAMLQLEGNELVELWSGRTMRNKMSGCVYYDGHLFGFDESILKCIDLDGKMAWRERGFGTGSMTIAGGRLVILDGKGQIIVAEANPEEYVELSRTSVFDDGTGWSSPVLSHGRIYCRSSLGPMACLDHRGVAIAATDSAEGSAPSVEAVLARHRAALGDSARHASLASLASVRMTGPGESLRNTVSEGAVELDWDREVGFSWRDDSGFQMAHDTEVAWSVGSRSGPFLFEGAGLEALREAGSLTRVFDPAAAYAQLGETSFATFDNRACIAVAATTHEGHARTVYFDAETGLLAGQEGEGILLWTLGDYREFDGVRLPTHWTFYEPELGEMSSAHFDSVEVDLPADAARFERPMLVHMLLRSPEEVARDEARLTQEHGAYLGRWRSDGEPQDAPPTILRVEDGFLVLTGEGDEFPPERLLEPDEAGVIRIIGAEYVSLTPVRAADDSIELLELRVGDELRERWLRVEG